MKRTRSKLNKIAIFSITKNFCMGVNDALAVRCKEDLQFFKNVTEDSFIMMGSKTMESLPKKLPNRYSIAVSNNPSKYIPNEKVDEVLPFDMAMIESIASSYYSEKQDPFIHEDIFIIGGPTLINQLAWEINSFVITEFDAIVAPYEGGVFFDPYQYHLKDDTKFIKIIMREQTVPVTYYDGSTDTVGMKITMYTRKNHD